MEFEREAIIYTHNFLKKYLFCLLLKKNKLPLWQIRTRIIKLKHLKDMRTSKLFILTVMFVDMLQHYGLA